MFMEGCKAIVLILGICIAGGRDVSYQDMSQVNQLYWEAVQSQANGKLTEALTKVKSAVKLAPNNKSLRDYVKELEDMVAAEQFDRYALDAPSDAERSVEELAKYLIKSARNDKEKIRLIFRWITDRIAYDTVSFFSGKSAETDAGSVLKSRKSVCEGYSNLFEALCNVGGIKAVKISGYAKGYGYKNGDKFANSNHAWNAVQLDGQWLMIDSTWGAGFTEKRTFAKRLNEFYYLTPPEVLIFSHLPKESQYQYIKSPVTKEQFETWPQVNYKLFNVGFKPTAIKSNLARPNSSFPEAYDYPAARIKFLDAPLTSTLSAGKNIVIRVEAPGAQEIKAVNNKEFIDFELKKFGLYEAALSPKRGSLSINAKLPGKGKELYTILDYHVE